MGAGERIKKVLSEKGMTIKELSELTGIPLNTLYSITKRDSKFVRKENLEKIADALGVSVKYLVGEEVVTAVEGIHDVGKILSMFVKAKDRVPKMSPAEFGEFWTDTVRLKEKYKIDFISIAKLVDIFAELQKYEDIEDTLLWGENDAKEENQP